MIDKIINEIKVWDNWQNNYKNFVPLFIEEAKIKNNWTEWDNKVFQEFFEKNRDQCVASLQQGYYSHDEKLKIKNNWSELAQMLSKISYQQDTLDLETYDKIRNWLRQFTTQNRKASANRLIASLQPKLLCTIVNEDRIKVLMQRINKNDSSASLVISNNWFENSNRVLNYFKNKLPNKDYYEIITYPWQTYDILNNQNNSQNSTPIYNNNDMSETQDETDFLEILQYKKQIILQGPPGTGKTKLAKEIAAEMLGLSHTEKLENNEQFKLIQFHPSYTYEDFVRGIVAESKGEKIEYKDINKTLGLFAEEALKNYLDSKKESSELSKEIQLKKYFDQFVESIEDELEKNHSVILTDSVSIINVEEDAFRYKGENGWAALGNRMTFKDILQAYNDSNTTRQEIKHNTKLSGLARQHSSYFIRVVNKFIAFLAKQNKIIEKHEIEKVTLKNYILIIDEINRANLSSVLGELIYALEYRGESVNSIYAVENSVLSNKNHLILPPNLFIIGTMNTADRSVGHIDYAIRRRFAFIDVLPKNLSTDDTIKFDSELFISIKNLFTTDDYKTRSVYLSNEFEPKDVALGHSYFIDKSDEGGSMAIRLEYEIKPILLEYIKDGILIGEDIKEKINSLQASI
ncbi:AAA family ATPase [Elizabethkingia anophelis]|uniref:AAA+ ATPase domain-containing protein n=1 Tax=Elizabethkingia anophelis TaxID=1117645 RepID=A0A494J7D9_9FLAO|nr:AAA family ATPase [Elizabethkingia anophelis]AQX50805.1 hypothetical protein AYC66_08990 [Elizabethkingia anophelis]MDV2445620.1 hypothetical protein [Elizabethkingia anophelis]MDV2474175.1 hypothetical protein [Elizabethkingia anophelis]MDV3536367.1 hypothetical protein [Elizabethkingia anophelis]MDV3556140.1 hypothetical protein [Elizabethkingia anophelis]